MRAILFFLQEKKEEKPYIVPYAEKAARVVPCMRLLLSLLRIGKQLYEPSSNAHNAHNALTPLYPYGALWALWA